MMHESCQTIIRIIKKKTLANLNNFSLDSIYTQFRNKTHKCFENVLSSV